MLPDRVTELVRGGSDAGFAELALAVFAYQYEADPRYRRLCDRQGATPRSVSDWREVPAAPAAAWPSPAAGAPAAAAHEELHRAVIDRTFPAACMAGMSRPPVLSLIPAEEGPSGPGPALLADQVLRAWAAPDSLAAATGRGVQVARARSFLGARQRDRRPTLLLGATAGLAALLEALERRGLRFRLPPGSRVVETGRRRTGGRELLARLAEGLGVPPEDLIREYAAEGLATRFYAAVDPQGRSGPFSPPPWTRVRALDPATRAELPAGSEGELAIFDLASLGGTAHVLTGDAGSTGDGGFRLAAASASS